MPNLIQIQIDSFDWFKNHGPAGSCSKRSRRSPTSPARTWSCASWTISFGEPRYDVFECRQRDMTYAAPLRVRVQLLIKETGEIKESEIFMGDFPLMTENGTFVINGAERVVVSQLVRSPGVYFTATEDPNTGRKLFGAKLIPNRGAWLEFETSNKDLLSVKVDRKRKIPVTILLRAIGYAQRRGAARSCSSRRQHQPRPRLHARPPSTRTAPRPRKRRSSSSTSGCAPATRPPWTTPRACSTRSCSTRAATTWRRWAATS